MSIKDQLSAAQESVHVAEVILRNTTGRSGRLTTICDDGAEPFPSGWHDELVCHTIRRNKDGSITVVALINIYGDDGQKWTVDRTIRLERG